MANNRTEENLHRWKKKIKKKTEEIKLKKMIILSLQI